MPDVKIQLRSNKTTERKGTKNIMENTNTFYLECPAFDAVPETHISVTNASRTPAINRRDYAHPIDGGIIKILNQPGVSTAFGAIADLAADSYFSPLLEEGIPVNRKNYPEINDMVDRCVSILGVKRPYVVISSQPGVNAHTFGSDAEPYVVLNNMLVRVMDPEKLMFIIGHECGHIAMGHLIYHMLSSTLMNYSRFIPLIGPLINSVSGFALNAWNRRSEITADRAGLLCCQNPEAAKRALLQLGTGCLNSDNIDVDNYIENSKRFRRGSVLRRINDFSRTHPPLPKRIEALEMFANSEVYYEALGMPAPAGVMSRANLNTAVEKIIVAMGKE